jgi:hypothetical protein
METPAKKARVNVTTPHLSILKDSYDKHFSEYCEHKKNPVQRIPTMVWKSVYEDFLVEIKNDYVTNGVKFDPKDLPTEQKLQDNLREFIDSLGTGTSDLGKGNVNPQSEANLIKIKLTDGHRRRNMINLREELIKTDAEIDGKEGVVKMERKIDVQKRAVDNLEKMTDSIIKNGDKITTLLEGHAETSQKKMHLYEESNQNQSTYMMLRSLKTLLEQKVISEVEYKERAKKVLEKM